MYEHMECHLCPQRAGALFHCGSIFSEAWMADARNIGLHELGPQHNAPHEIAEGQRTNAATSRIIQPSSIHKYALSKSRLATRTSFGLIKATILSYSHTEATR